MKKELMTIVLAVALIFSISMPAAAYEAQEKNAADALHQMGLFLGYGTTYGLDDTLTRQQGYILMIRMLGEEEAALSCTYTHPFTDIAKEDRYVAYAYATGLTKGIDATHFGGKNMMSAQQFAAICLRALGYSDNEGGDFTYADAKSFAAEKNIKVPEGTQFDRGDCVQVFWDTLHAVVKDGSATLSTNLMKKGVFEKTALQNAERIYANGITAGDNTGEKGTEVKPATSSGGGAAPAPCAHKKETSEIIIQPSCNATGIRSYSCPDCGITRTEIIQATNEHVVVEDAAIPATCTSVGKTAGSHCSVCSIVITRQQAIPMKEHTPKTLASIAPTCTTAGKTEGSQCAICNGVIRAQLSISPLGHNYENKVCTRCGTEDPRGEFELPSLPLR